MNNATLFVVSLLLNGCMLASLNEDINQLETAVTIAGRVEVVADSAAPIIVTLTRLGLGDEVTSLQDYTVIYGSSDFFFTVPEGDYYALAFEDVNHDFTLQDDERVGWYGSPNIIEAQSGQLYRDLTIRLRDPGDAKNELPDLYVPGEVHGPLLTHKKKLGLVVDTSAFNAELGSLGMWEPVKFYAQGHVGIYFLEPYDSEKLPVLFVHGIGGSGHDWLPLIEQLDRKRYQPWIAQYPSGMRLGLISQFFSQSVNELRAVYDFNDLAIVAHSMGGLVSRGLINDQASNGLNKTIISTFVTISTPWLGHTAAGQGAKYAPVAVPSWFDMVPKSPYLESLHEQVLPAETGYYLLFGHKGKGGGVFGRTNSDGVVTLSSQLSMKAQDEAIKSIGYNEDHTSILKSTSVAKKIGDILQRGLKE